MPLDKTQLKKVQDWMASKNIRGQCLYCGSSSFTTGEIVAAPSHVGGGMSIGGPTVPMVQVICSTCG
ncbi:MAG: hypothetical protein Q8P59_00045, partial [Dehalococcoidia bacterium]|nr:hypothetical protein [Dehalococcoidia bacterium]